MPNLIHSCKQIAKAGLNEVAARLGPHRTSRETRLWVLMYHRVLPVSDPRYAQEEPGMIVTPDSFRQQLRILKQLFTVMPLSDWSQRQAAGKPLPQRACAITFDDGWRDNFEYALPILQQEQTPATVFAVAGMIGTNTQFWPNRLTHLLQLAPAKRSEKRSFDWLQGLPGYTSNEEPSREAVAALINACKRFSDAELYAHLDCMEAEAGQDIPAGAALMNWSELRQMQATGLVEIGSHTCHHTRLVEGLAEQTLRAEIVDSRHRLESELDKPVNLFCYPNGDISPAAATLVSQQYSAAVTTQFGINRSNAPAHHLQRIGIHEDVSNTPTRFHARLSGW